MSAPRLPFLWPMLFRPFKGARPSPRHSRQATRTFAVTACRAEPPAHSQRYGTAHDPEAHLREQQQKEKEKSIQAKLTSEKPAEQPVEEEEEEAPSPTIAPSARPNSDEPVVKPTPPETPRVPETKVLETVLHMPSPSEEESRKPPHLKTPPYVHHFDTYSLVKQLNKGGFTPDQAVTTMKAVRGILTENLEFARKSLVSKSNVENETYLFRAACSELRIEVENNRNREIEKMRTERNQLQHEVDILNQKLGQETSHMKDELKGLFDDRKMAVRQEQRLMDSKIQELNYKITVALNSDARSEVEALRWVLTRRAAITIGTVAFTLFLLLRYNSFVAHNQQEEKRKKAQRKNPPSDGGQDNSPQAPSPIVSQETIGGEILATNGVSLG